MTRKRALVGMVRCRVGRALMRSLRVALVALCVVGLAVGPSRNWQPTAAAGTAAEADPNGPPDLLYSPKLGDTPNPNGGDTLYAATPSQAAALRALQDMAVANVIRDHGLDPGAGGLFGDNAAVKSWGRSEAQAELFLLIVQAIKTPIPARTTTQQEVVNWMTAVQQRQNQRAAEAAGIEYVRWAGLNEAAFRQLISTNVGAGVLTNFLDDDPYSGSTTGYCEYHPPAPFDTIEEYSGRSVQQCFTNCTNVLGCDPPTPSYDQFVKWGSASANYAIVNSADFAQTSSTIAVAVIVGAGAGIGTAALVGGTAGLVGTFGGGTLFAATFFPWAAVGSSVAAAGAASLVIIVVLAIVAAVLQGINVFNAAALPGQLANLIAAATNDTPNLYAISGTPQGLQGLFTLFVGATMPAPRNATCSNMVVVSNPLNPYPPFCLNAPPIPATRPTDLFFSIRAQGAATTTTARSLTWRDTALNATKTVRLSGNWFVTQVNGVDTAQSFRIQATDWAGQEQTVWLLGNPTDGYKFLGFTITAQTNTPIDPATCADAGTCFYSSALEYVGADGQMYTATVVPRPQTTFTSITHSPVSPVAGQPVTFQATATSPDNLPITYSWSFQRPSGECPTNAPCYITLSGSTVVFPPVSRFVEVTATDAGEATNTTTYTFPLKYPAEITWATPAPVTYGTPLNATQLNAVGGNPNAIIIGTGEPAIIPGSFTYSFNGQPVGPGTILPAGNNVIRAHFTPDDLAAWAPSTKDVTLVVNKAPLTLVANNKTMTYGAAIPALDVRYDGLVNGDTGAAVNGLTCVALNPLNGIVSAPPVGGYRIACSGASAANYTIAYTDGTLTVNRAPLTIAARNQQMVLRGAVPPLAADYRGLVNGDTPAALTTAPTCTTTATTASAAGSYPITCTGAASANYTISYAPGALRIVYQFGGFPAPLGGGGPTPSFKAGGTVVIAFQLKDATGAPTQATTAPTFSASPAVPCAAGAVDPGTSVAGGPGTPYRWDSAARQYIYSYKVANSFAGSCQFLRATFDDGTTQTVFVAYTK